MFHFPALLLSSKMVIVLNIYFTFNCASFHVANPRSFSFFPRSVGGYLVEPRGSCAVWWFFFQLHSFSLKLLIFHHLTPPLALERWDCPVLCLREFQREIANLIFGNTAFNNIPNSRWQKDLAPNVKEFNIWWLKYFFHDEQTVLGWMYPWDPRRRAAIHASQLGRPSNPPRPPFHHAKSLRCVKMPW